MMSQILHSKRDFIKTVNSLCLGSFFGSSFMSLFKREPSRAHVLSTTGCGRATGYAEANKIVRCDGKIHCAWLDSDQGRFFVRIKTFNQQGGSWSPTYTVGEAYDNHGGPALTIDAQGYLHIVYHPHHHAMKYRKSTKPNDAVSWENETTFGQKTTYPTLLCAKDGTLLCSVRRSFKHLPWQLELWRKPPNRSWQGPQVLLRARYLGYAHFQESMAWDSKHSKLHLVCRVHEKTDETGYGKIQTVAYLESIDGAQTWQRSDGSTIPKSATVDQCEILEQGGVEVGRILRCSNIVVDHAEQPLILFSERVKKKASTFLARRVTAGKWDYIQLNELLPPKLRSKSLVVPGGVSIHGDGRIFITCQLQDHATHEEGWGHSSNEVILFSSKSDDKFSCEILSDDHTPGPKWLPNIEKRTGFNDLGKRPAILYTHGDKGADNRAIMSNKVVAVI